MDVPECGDRSIGVSWVLKPQDTNAATATSREDNLFMRSFPLGMRIPGPSRAVSLIEWFLAICW